MRNFKFGPGDEKIYFKEDSFSMGQRDRALEAIRAERIYQINKWGFKDVTFEAGIGFKDGVYEARKQPSQFLYYAEGYLAEAKEKLSKNAYGDVRRDVCLIAMKVAALMTALMEQHGVETR